MKFSSSCRIKLPGVNLYQPLPPFHPRTTNDDDDDDDDTLFVMETMEHDVMGYEDR